MDNLTELLECSICLEQLTNSNKVLPCQHTFCTRCLQVYFKKKQECPECRSTVQVKLETLPSNILVNRFLEVLKQSAVPSKSEENDSSSDTRCPVTSIANLSLSSKCVGQRSGSARGESMPSPLHTGGNIATANGATSLSGFASDFAALGSGGHTSTTGVANLRVPMPPNLRGSRSSSSLSGGGPALAGDAGAQQQLQLNSDQMSNTTSSTSWRSGNGNGSLTTTLTVNGTSSASGGRLRNGTSFANHSLFRDSSTGFSNSPFDPGAQASAVVSEDSGASRPIDALTRLLLAGADREAQPNSSQANQTTSLPVDRPTGTSESSSLTTSPAHLANAASQPRPPAIPGNLRTNPFVDLLESVSGMPNNTNNVTSWITGMTTSWSTGLPTSWINPASTAGLTVKTTGPTLSSSVSNLRAVGQSSTNVAYSVAPSSRHQPLAGQPLTAPAGSANLDPWRTSAASAVHTTTIPVFGADKKPAAAPLDLIVSGVGPDLSTLAVAPSALAGVGAGALQLRQTARSTTATSNPLPPHASSSGPLSHVRKSNIADAQNLLAARSFAAQFLKGVSSANSNNTSAAVTVPNMFPPSVPLTVTSAATPLSSIPRIVGTLQASSSNLAGGANAGAAAVSKEWQLSPRAILDPPETVSLKWPPLANQRNENGSKEHKDQSKDVASFSTFRPTVPKAQSDSFQASADGGNVHSSAKINAWLSKPGKKKNVPAEVRKELERSLLVQAGLEPSRKFGSEVNLIDLDEGDRDGVTSRADTRPSTVVSVDESSYQRERERKLERIRQMLESHPTNLALAHATTDQQRPPQHRHKGERYRVTTAYPANGDSELDLQVS